MDSHQQIIRTLDAQIALLDEVLRAVERQRDVAQQLFAVNQKIEDRLNSLAGPDTEKLMDPLVVSLVNVSNELNDKLTHVADDTRKTIERAEAKGAFETPSSSAN